MKNVQVLLREDVHELGRVGDVVKVAPGYARNYLLPHRLGVEATAENIRAMKRRRSRIDAELKARAAEFDAIVQTLGALQLSTTMKADATGRLFGSVNAHAVARLLSEAGRSVPESQVRLSQPIKTVGTHTVLVHVHGDLHAEVKVEVLPEDEAPSVVPQTDPADAEV